MKQLDIAQVTKQCGLPPSTLRFYEEKGLIQSIGRKGLRRQYHENVLQRLALIALGQSAGFSLTEIAGMFNQQGEPALDREMLAAKANEIGKTIQRLSAIRDGLNHAANCPAPNHMQCPAFQKMLKAAGTKSTL
ncbi:helix-turn-helix domain-containing protein [Pragia fontium]|uniref:DNA-binding transcriptional regulator, MerR family n=2 Tax=Pragia fontium TaxID=82985 RepID=A0AAJ4W7X2_9GAMM|nr:MerR family transcriptional regulator [Pragia fontium]SFC06443.1 DNA-binding transcriptional regulator, MerR family [Pragia fontium DSM 5563 = ATCC 49100]VEJ53887.1 Redox-sensitive transcriptional activator soxR [Pragia fontium]